MTPCLKISLCAAFICAVSPGVSSLRAQAMILMPTEVDATAATSIRAETPLVRTWLHGASARFGFGYSDNVLWSALEREGRGFAQAELEAFAWRPQRRGWEAKAFLTGEVRRYGDPLPEARGEQRWIARGEIAAMPNAHLRLALTPQAFYSDQVYDLSADIGRRFVAKMRVGGISGTLHARLSLPRGWAIEPSVQQRSTDYFDFAEDYSETKAGARVRWRKSARFEISAAAYDHARPYRERVNYTAGGRPLADTELEFHQTSGELAATWSWDARGRWSVSPTLAYLENRDRASGFFDYDLRRARCDLAWQGVRWRVDAEASAGRYDYRVQTVGMGLAPPARLREDFTVGATIEYAFNARWKTVTRYAWERSRTNEVNASYRINTVSTAVAWTY